MPPSEELPVGQSVYDRILANFDSLPAKQRQLARYFLDHGDAAAFASTGEIADHVGASPATVVRFARSLGYDGYSDLQNSIRAGFPRYRTVVQKMAEHVANGDDVDELAHQIMSTGARNVQETIRRVNEADLEAAVEAIINARRILICGSGLSTAAAVLAEHTLRTLGFMALTLLNGGVAQALQLSHLTERDLIIVVSLWRYIHSTVEAAEAARKAGAFVVALTDSPVAPVAGIADVTFVADTEGAAHSRSLLGILALIDLLGAAVVSRRPEASMAAIRRIDRLYRENNLLISD